MIRGLLNLTLFFLLLGQAGLVYCLLNFGHVPLPTEWINSTIAKRLPYNLDVRAGSYAFTLSGTLQIRDLKIGLKGIERPIFTADRAHAGFRVPTLERKTPLKEFVLSQGRLILPAVYAPDGSDRTLLDSTALRLVPEDEVLRLDSFAALHEDIRLRGGANWAIDLKPDRNAIDVKQAANSFFTQAATLLKEKAVLTGLTRPTILFEIEGGNDRPFEIKSRISSRQFERPEIFAQFLTLDTTLSIVDQKIVKKSSIFFDADQVTLPEYGAEAVGLSAKIEQENWDAIISGEWPSMEVSAEELRVEGITLHSPRIDLRPQNFPKIDFKGSMSGLKGAVAFSGEVDLETRAAALTVDGNLDLLSVAPPQLVEKLPAIALQRAPYYNLDLLFEPGFALTRADLRTRADAVQIEELLFQHIRFRANYEDGVINLPRLYLRRDWQWMDVGFRLDRKTNDYFISLFGSAKPYDYNPILPRWWGGIFKEFDFESFENGLGDFVIYGNTKNKTADFFFGRASAEDVAYKDVRIDAGELIVWGRGPYAEITGLDVRKGEGFARGQIQFTSRIDDVRGPLSVRLALDTKLTLGDAGKLFDEDIARVLADFQSEALPRATLKGAIFNKAYPEFAGRSYIDVTATCPAPLSYKGLPLDYLGFDLFGRPDQIYLRNLHLGYAGGTAEAEADLLTGEETPAHVRLRGTLTGANQAKAIAPLNQSKIKEAAKEGEKMEDDAATPAGIGQLDLALHASGPVDAPLDFDGFGHLRIENDELYAIQLFGPLSQLLQNTILGFTSFGLSEIDAVFRMEAGVVHFSKFEVNGPRTRIEAPGSFRLSDASLAMRVSVFLFKNAGNPDSNLRRFGDFIRSPIPNLLEFELTGTPENQNWRSLYDPRNFMPRSIIPRF